jgi:proteic killer suppression protein
VIENIKHKVLRRLYEKSGRSGDRRGTYSVTVKANWRVTSRFLEGAVRDVNLEDYH